MSARELLMLAVTKTWVASGVLLNMAAIGMHLSLPTYLLPALRSPESSIRTDLETASWLASCAPLASAPGYVVSWLMMDWRGRRISHLMLITPGVIAWLLYYIATNIPTLMAGRILSGLSAGCTVCLGANVIGEYSSPQLRGVLLNLKTAALCLGNIILHTLGHFFQWRTVTIYGFVIHLAAFIIICTWPESPAWLASKKRFGESKKSFAYLRGSSTESKREIEDLIRAQKRDTTKLDNKCKLLHFKEFLKRFTKKDFTKPFLVAFVAAVLQESSGRHFFPTYALQIIEAAGGKIGSFYVVLGIYGVAGLGATTVAALVRAVKCRVLLFTSAIAALLVLAIFCTYQGLVSYNLITGHSAISFTLLVIYFILINIGCSPIPLAIIGEIFPLAHRGAGPAALGIALSLYMMMLFKIIPVMLINVKVYGMFAIFGVVMAASLLILYYILPETKDRTLQEIEDYFNNEHYDGETRLDEKTTMISESPTKT